MTGEMLPEDIRRLVVNSVPSVPYLEALLLMHEKQEQTWHGKSLAQRLYISEEMAGDILSSLFAAGYLARTGATPVLYRFFPQADGLRHIVDKLAGCYAKHLIEITTLIHRKTGKQAQHFADAFKLRKDS